MGDNKTSSPAAQYDAHIFGVNPNYHLFHEDTLDLVKTVNLAPVRWLDTGCGTGTLVARAAGLFPETAFTLADPSRAMLDIAVGKLAGIRAEFLLKGTLELDVPGSSFDVITAIQSHHYFNKDERIAATQNCFRMLRVGGVYVTFENIRPFSETGVRIGLQRWSSYQLGCGRSPDEVEKHMSRFGVEYFPITVQQHLDLLRGTGFTVAEILFMGMMQAGFYAIKQ
jgi:tRNA (cmo5U34)-methyltransferase